MLRRRRVEGEQQSSKKAKVSGPSQSVHDTAQLCGALHSGGKWSHEANFACVSVRLGREPLPHERAR